MAEAATDTQTAPAPTVVKLKTRGTLQIATNRMDLASYKANTWRAFPEEGTDYATVLTGPYWAHRAADLKPGDKIEVLPDEMSYYAELLVIAGAPVVKLVELFRKELAPAATGEITADYFVEWKGPHRKFAVIRKADGAIISDGYAQKQDALAATPRTK